MGLLEQFARFRKQKQEEDEFCSSSLFAEGFATPGRQRARQPPDAREYVSWAEASGLSLGRPCQATATRSRRLQRAACSQPSREASRLRLQRCRPAAPWAPSAAAAAGERRCGPPASAAHLPPLPLRCRSSPSCRWRSRR